jgi:hypothetical protein
MSHFKVVSRVIREIKQPMVRNHRKLFTILGYEGARRDSSDYNLQRES